VQGEVVKKVAEWFYDDRMDIFEFSFKTGSERPFFTVASKVRRRTKGEVAQEDLVDPEGDLTGEEVADVLGMRLAGSGRPLAEGRGRVDNRHHGHKGGVPTTCWPTSAGGARRWHPGADWLSHVRATGITAYLAKAVLLSTLKRWGP
jgi:hypothetical protein